MRYNKCVKCGSSVEKLRVMPNGSLHQFCAKCGIDLTLFASRKGQDTKRRNAVARKAKRRIVTRQYWTQYTIAMLVFSLLIIGFFISI